MNLLAANFFSVLIVSSTLFVSVVTKDSSPFSKAALLFAPYTPSTFNPAFFWNSFKDLFEYPPHMINEDTKNF